MSSKNHWDPISEQYGIRWSPSLNYSSVQLQWTQFHKNIKKAVCMLVKFRLLWDVQDWFGNRTCKAISIKQNSISAKPFNILNNITSFKYRYSSEQQLTTHSLYESRNWFLLASLACSLLAKGNKLSTTEVKLQSSTGKTSFEIIM